MAQENLEKELEECKKLCAQYLESWKRERADFLNYKKDESERISALAKYANESLILKLIPVFDNFYIASKHVNLEKEEKGERGIGEEGLAEIVKGFNQIKNQMKEFLKSQGVEIIDALGKKFDPNFHEAVEEVEEPSFVPQENSGLRRGEGVVIDIVKNGYMLNGKVIRPAKVKVAK